MFEGNNFPDNQYLLSLIHDEESKAQNQLHKDRLLTACSANLNWIADYVLDPNIEWIKEMLDIDDLYLTGTCPEWNKIIIDQCNRSAEKLRDLVAKDEAIAKKLCGKNDSNFPILIRYEDGKYKVLDGMHRVITIIIAGYPKINAFVGRLKGEPQPQCEPHVVYDFLRSYHRGINRDREGLITALRFLRKSYSNVEKLLKERFSKEWIPSNEIQEIIQEALK